MHDHQNDGLEAIGWWLSEPLPAIDIKKRLFERTVDCAFSKVFSSTEPPKLSLTVMEALLVGIGQISMLWRLKRVKHSRPDLARCKLIQTFLRLH
jgi:hypothetical protein